MGIVRQRTAKLLLLLAFVGACSDHQPTAPTIQLSGRVIVSAPIAVQPGSGARVAGLNAALIPANSGAVYVSAPPGTVPSGVSASITDKVSGQSLTVAMSDGGFDPVALVARVGDQLTIVVHDRLGGVLASTNLVVPPHQPPAIVRTNPPHGMTDVPLNTQIEIVFSEPVDSASLSGAVQLSKGGLVIPGALSLAAPGVVAELLPAAPLAPSTEYELLITVGVRNVNGESLEGATSISFTTQAGSAAIAVSAGNSFTCALATGGLPYCWGANWGGQLGDGSTTSRTTPVAVTGLPSGARLSMISAGGDHACGVTTDGQVYCWGGNMQAQLGNRFLALPLTGDPTLRTVQGPEYCVTQGAQCSRRALPIEGLPAGVRFSTVSAGTYHTCALSIDGAAYCWGSNNWGKLGIGIPSGSGPERCFGTTIEMEGGRVVGGLTIDGDCSTRPLPVVGNLSFSAISAGAGIGIADNGGQTCGITTDHKAYCWGVGTGGQLGGGPLTSGDTVMLDAPAAVLGGLAFMGISAGYHHTCAIATSGVPYCWGEDWLGALGNGSPESTSIPVAVGGNLTFTGINGRGHSCGLTIDGTAYCWGLNDSGQLGTGSSIGPETCAMLDASAPCSRTPVRVAGNGHYTTISAGGEHTCAIGTDGTVYCWGKNDVGEAPAAVRLPR